MRRQAYPLIWCVSEDTRAKLLGRISDRDIIPPEAWVPWQVTENPATIPAVPVNYDKFIRQAPSKSRG